MNIDEKMTGLVSIIMPSYNTASLIGEAIQSVQAQSYQNWELLIVDDCSTDHTDDAVQPYLADGRIRYLKNESNSGAAISRNRALREAKGKWIAFLDSDDLWMPEKLAKQIRFMEENGYHFSYTNYSEIDTADQANGITVTGPRRITKTGFFNYCWPGCLTVMYDAEAIGTIQIADIRKNNDYAMWLKVCRKADCYLLDEDLALYRRGRAGSISTHSIRNLISWHYKLYKEAEGQNALIAVFNTCRNMAFGFYKKIRYVKKRHVKMGRDSFLYQARRKCQALAHKVVSNEALSKLYFRIMLHQKLDLKEPQTFNEKIQWMKLYYYPRNPLVVSGADKYAVRAHIAEKGYGDHLVPLLGVWDSAGEIDWEKLPDRFVLKCNHGCAYNIVVPDKSKLDQAAAVKQLNKWLKEDFGAFNLEIHYSAIKHRLITCEAFLGENITDYKFFCFNGKPHCFYVSADLIHDRQAQMGFFDLDGNKMPLRRDDYADLPQITLPPFYDEMKKAAQVLCRDFPFVRVDFFIANHTWYFAELTFTPGAGMMPFHPKKYDAEWGRLLTLPI